MNILHGDFYTELEVLQKTSLTFQLLVDDRSTLPTITEERPLLPMPQEKLTLSLYFRAINTISGLY